MRKFLIQKIIHLIQFFKHKYLYERQSYEFSSPQLLPQEELETALLSESSLQKDWLTPEEDEAWQHL